MQIRDLPQSGTMDVVRAQIPEWVRHWECNQREMLGSSAYFVNRNLFAMLKANEVLVRLPEFVANELLDSQLTARRLSSADGRVCREFVVLPYTSQPDRQQMSSLRQWVERSAQFVATLPPRSKVCSILHSG